MPGRVMVVVGGQYGSEGKGVIVKHIADEYDVHVRVGGCNAGHSFYHRGQKHVVQSIPIGWTNPKAMLFLGAGAVVSPKILLKELKEISKIDPTVTSRLVIDGNASVLGEAEHQAEGGVDGELHQRIGSTGEGVGAARLGRLGRDPTKFLLARSVPELAPWIEENTPEIIQNSLATCNVLVEGTQGSGLSLVHGPWPHCTTADCNAAGIIADVGLSPLQVTDILLVVRTYPIRVAGNSGPLKNEITWEQLSEKLGKTVHEKTTVTKKTRRIGMWDDELFHRAVVLNRPTAIAVTFLDYIDPADEGKTKWDQLSVRSRCFVQRVESLSGRSVDFIGTGGEGWKVVDRRDD